MNAFEQKNNFEELHQHSSNSRSSVPELSPSATTLSAVPYVTSPDFHDQILAETTVIVYSDSGTISYVPLLA
eukprot:9257026-Ditylum_brightwellii.AAC.1